jgi:hypothetical protein
MTEEKIVKKVCVDVEVPVKKSRECQLCGDRLTKQNRVELYAKLHDGELYLAGQLCFSCWEHLLTSSGKRAADFKHNAIEQKKILVNAKAET